MSDLGLQAADTEDEFRMARLDSGDQSPTTSQPKASNEVLTRHQLGIKEHFSKEAMLKKELCEG